MCVYDKYPLTGRDIQYQAPNNRSRYTTPLDKIKSNVQHLKNSGIPMILVIKNVILWKFKQSLILLQWVKTGTIAKQS